MRNLDGSLRPETGVVVHVAEDHLGCVAVGSGRYLEELRNFLGRNRSSC